MILPLLLAASLSAPPAISILVRAPDGTLTEPTEKLKGGNFSGPGAPPYEGRLRYGYGRGYAPPQQSFGRGFGTSRTPSHAGVGHRGGGRERR